MALSVNIASTKVSSNNDIWMFFSCFCHTPYALPVKGDRYAMPGRMEVCKRRIKIAPCIESCALTPIMTHHLSRQVEGINCDGKLLLLLLLLLLQF